MTSHVIEVKSGRSRPGASTSTVIGALAGDKKSQRSVKNAVLNSGARTYYVKKQVWICNNASCLKGLHSISQPISQLGKNKYIEKLSNLVIILFIFLILAAAINKYIIGWVP